jgi:hypothetical protein
MPRTLATVAGVALLVAVVCLSAAAAIGGPEFMRHAGWSWGWHGHRMHYSEDGSVSTSDDDGPQATRDFAWTGGQDLRVGGPIEVRYVDGAPAKVTASGPASLVNALKVQSGDIDLDGVHLGGDQRVTVTVTAPGVSRFHMGGATKLEVEDYKQPNLTLDLSGASEATVSGQTQTLALEGSGAARAHLEDLKAAEVTAKMSGAATAKVTALRAAKLDASGAGGIELANRPAQLDTSTSGAGHISVEGDDD